MAADTKKQGQQAASTGSAHLSAEAQAAADKFKASENATEVFTDRPVVKPDALGKENFMPVIGLLVSYEDLPLPKGVERTDVKTKETITTWGAFVIHLTEPTKAYAKNGRDGDLITITPGREVFVAINNSNKHLLNKLGTPEMFKVCMLWDGELESAGKNPMTKWRVIIGEKTVIRTGAFLVGGSQAHAALNGAPPGVGSAIEQAERVHAP